MKTVALYTRVSTQEQSAEGYSLGEQEERLRLYAKAHDWTVVAVYTDPGYSGAKLERPSIQKLIRDCEKKSFDAVLIYKLDRLSRSQKDTLYLIEDVFNKNEIGLVSMRENFDTQTPFGKAMIGILSVFAQLERDQITERMNMGRLGRAKAGYYSGGSCPPIGYTYTRADGDDKHTLQIDEYEAMQVRKVFDLFNNGLDGRPMTFTAIRTYMHERYKTRYGTWTATSTVTNMLSDPVYIGCVSFGGKYYPGIHEPIISKDLFDKTQRKLERYRKSVPSSFAERFKGQHLLTGMLHCGLCGGRYFLKSWTRPNGRHYRKYVCYTQVGQNKKMSKGECNNVKYEMTEMEDAVIGEIRKLKENELRIVDPATPSDDSTKEVRQHIKELEKQEEKIIDLYQIGTIDIDLVKKKSEAIQKEKKKLEKVLSETKKKAPQSVSRDEAIELLGTFDEIIQNGSLQEKRELLRSLIEDIVVFPDHIEIHWTFSVK